MAANTFSGPKGQSAEPVAHDARRQALRFSIRQANAWRWDLCRSDRSIIRCGASQGGDHGARWGIIDCAFSAAGRAAVGVWDFGWELACTPDTLALAPALS